jgi:eukaryotic-like serine/threonine-protein kinase
VSDRSSDSSANYLLLTQLADEFAARYRAGERPGLREYIERYPHLADDIRELFAAMVEIEQVKEDHEEAATAGSETRAERGEESDLPPSPALQQLGDYRIIREVGKGGMGIVYEAEQVSLGRHVALKVLPKNMLLDAKAKRRFEREAKSAAKLHHTNIVPVFGVGEQDGLPYYVMQFIQGLGLDAVLEELKKFQLGNAKTGTYFSGELRVSRTGGQASNVPGEERRGRETRAERGRESRAERANPSQGGLSAVHVARSLLTGEFERTVDYDSGKPAPEAAAHDKSADALHLPPVSDSFTLSSSSVVLPGRGSDGGKSKNKKQTYWQSVASIGVQVAEALEYAHKQGIHHRDIKPSNLLLDTQGTVWVTDFGLAKADDQQNLTHTGDILGTLRYMPPEAFEGKTDAKSDVYSLGLTVYEMLAFRPAFDERERNRLIMQVMHEEPARLGKLNRHVPQDLQTIVHKAIDKDPKQRYGSAGALAEDLQRFIEDEPIQARRASRTERLWRWCRRHPAQAAASVLAFLVLVALATLAVGYSFVLQLRKEQGRTHVALEEATKQRALTAEAQHQSQQLSARLALERGLSLCQQGNTGQGLLWMARSLELVPEGDPDLERDIRSNVARWRTSLHRLQAVWHTPCPLEALAVSPDGKLFLTGGTDGIPRLWDMATGRLLQELPREHASIGVELHHKDGVSGVFSPDGKTVLTGGDGFKARLWDVAGGKPLGPPLEHQGRVHALAFSPDGKTILTGSEDGTARVWDAALRTPLGTVMHHQGGVIAVAFSPDGKLILTGSRGQKARLWEAGTGKPIGAPLVHQGEVQGVAFAPDGNTIVTGVSVNVAQRWDVATHKPIGEPLVHQDNVNSVAFSPDGKIIASGSLDKTLRLWEARTGKPLLPVLLHGGPVNAVAFTPDGKSVLTASADSTVRLWEVGTGDPFGTPLRHEGILMAVAFSPDGKTVLTGSIDKTARLWDAATGRELRQFRGHQGGVWAVAYSPDGKTILTGSSDRTAQLWNVDTGEPIHHALKHNIDVIAAAFMTVAFNPNGKTVATATAEEVRVWDAATGQPIGPPHREGPSSAVAFSPDGSLLLTGSQTGTPWLLDSATGKSLRTLTPAHQGPIDAVALSPDGRTCLTASYADKTVKLWETASGKAIGQPLQHRVTAAAFFAAAFSPDSKTVATGGADEIARLWNATTGVPIGQPMRHHGTVWTVAFSHDGKMLLTGSVDGTARLWDAATGKPIGTPLQHPGRVRAVVFSPDGKKIATACGDNTARLWELPAPVQGDLERIVLWAQVVTGMKLDADGDIQVLDGDTWRQLRQRLDALGGPPVQ